MSTQTTRLKNGAEEATVHVLSTTLALHALIKRDHNLLYELVMACRDRSHRPFGNSLDFPRLYGRGRSTT